MDRGSGVVAIRGMVMAGVVVVVVLEVVRLRSVRVGVRKAVVFDGLMRESSGVCCGGKRVSWYFT